MNSFLCSLEKIRGGGGLQAMKYLIYHFKLPLTPSISEFFLECCVCISGKKESCLHCISWIVIPVSLAAFVIIFLCNFFSLLRAFAGFPCSEFQNYFMGMYLCGSQCSLLKVLCRMHTSLMCVMSHCFQILAKREL